MRPTHPARSARPHHAPGSGLPSRERTAHPSSRSPHAGPHQRHACPQLPHACSRFSQTDRTTPAGHISGSQAVANPIHQPGIRRTGVVR